VKIKKFLELKGDLIKENQIVNLIFKSSEDEVVIEAQMIEFGWGLDKSRIYYRFKINKSSDEKLFPLTSEFILPLSFTGKEVKFWIYPYFNESKGQRKMTQLIYNYFVNLI
jgi:hypothetical protein